MKSLDPRFLDGLSPDLDDLTTISTISEYCGKQQLYVKHSPDILESLRTFASIESTDASNRIEGVTAPEARIRELVAKKTQPRDRSEQEIAGYRDALELIHQSGEDMPVTVNVVLQLHNMLYSYFNADGGRWKMVDNDIVEKDADGNTVRVRFKPVSAVATPQAIEDLVSNYHQAQKDRRLPLIVIPLFILDFLCIHPFRDGNGRVSRLLTLQLLYHAGYEVGRYISLERIVEQSKESYYENLEASSHGWHEGEHDVKPWLRYFWGVLIRAYREFEERVGKVDKHRGSKSDRVREAAARKIAPFKIAELEREVPDVSRELIRRVLRDMKEEGLLEQQSHGRGAKWVPIATGG